MSQLTFNFNGAQFRTIEKDGEPWFVLKDVCEVLELANPRMVKDRLSEGVSSTYPLMTAGGMQQVTIINEDGLYDVILESRKPEAKAFRKWVTSDVLPSIRKHGTYMTPDTVEQFLHNPDTIIKIAQNWKQERDMRVAAEQKIEADRPLVLFAESVQISKDSILVNDLAKMLKQKGVDIGEKRMFEWLREEGYLIKSGSERNMPTQRSMDLKIMEIKMGSRNGSDGTIKLTRTPKITGKGQTYFINKFLGKGVVSVVN